MLDGTRVDRQLIFARKISKYCNKKKIIGTLRGVDGAATCMSCVFARALIVAFGRQLKSGRKFPGHRAIVCGHPSTEHVTLDFTSGVMLV